MTDVLDIFKALADEARLRIIHVLGAAELSVAELVSVLAMPQSTVSRHLKPLRDCQLVDTRREGTSVYYRRGSYFSDQGFTEVIGERLAQLGTAHRDLAAVQEVLELRRRRSKNFFDEIAGRYESLTEPGGGWRAVAFALGFAFSGKSVADIGCGEGDLSMLLARFAKRVVSVDMSAQMLAVLKEKAARFGCGHKIVTRQGGIEALPLEDESVDAVLMSQVLHHAAQPQLAITEASRVLRPGGQLVLLDLARHDQEWVREQWADQWFGFSDQELSGWLAAGGLTVERIETLPGNTPEMPVLIAVAAKAAGAGHE